MRAKPLNMLNNEGQEDFPKDIQGIPKTFLHKNRRGKMSQHCLQLFSVTHHSQGVGPSGLSADTSRGNWPMRQCIHSSWVLGNIFTGQALSHLSKCDHFMDADVPQTGETKAGTVIIPTSPTGRVIIICHLRLSDNCRCGSPEADHLLGFYLNAP